MERDSLESWRNEPMPHAAVRLHLAPSIFMMRLRLGAIMRAKLAALILLVLAAPVWAEMGPLVSIQPPSGTNTWPKLKSANPGALLTLQATTNFLDWTTVGTTHERFWNYPDAGAQSFARRFYRLRTDILT